MRVLLRAAKRETQASICDSSAGGLHRQEQTNRNTVAMVEAET